MGANNFKRIAKGAAAYVAPQATFEANATLRDNGFASGIVPGDMFNKVLRQSSTIAELIGQFTADNQPGDVLDNGDLAALQAQFLAALKQAVLAGAMPTRRVITANTVYNKPANLAYAFVGVQAAGGGGGASRTTSTNLATSAAAGGGPGAFISGIIPAANIGATETVTIGAAGAGGTGEGGNGVAGGTSSFGSHLTATGGAGGLGGNTPGVENNRGAAAGGAPGTASAAAHVTNVTINVGRRGGIAARFATSAIIGAAGGASQWSGGAGSNTEGSGGYIADGYGGGGGGASSGSGGTDGARNGGAGSQGMIEIWEFYSK